MESCSAEIISQSCNYKVKHLSTSFTEPTLSRHQSDNENISKETVLWLSLRDGLSVRVFSYIPDSIKGREIKKEVASYLYAQMSESDSLNTTEKWIHWHDLSDKISDLTFCAGSLTNQDEEKGVSSPDKLMASFVNQWAVQTSCAKEELFLHS